jgi:hypothetical protein
MNFFNTVYVSCPPLSPSLDMREAEVKQYLKRYDELEPRLRKIFVRFSSKETTAKVLVREIIKINLLYVEKEFFNFVSSPGLPLSSILEQVFIRYVFK